MQTQPRTDAAFIELTQADRNFQTVMDSPLYSDDEKRQAATAYGLDVQARLTNGQLVSTRALVMFSRATTRLSLPF